VGEALVSVLDEDGVPGIVERAGILPPRSSMKAADEILLQSVILASGLRDRYAQTEDRESAYEQLTEEREKEEKAAAEEKKKEEKAKAKTSKKTTGGRKKKGVLEKALSSTANTIGRELGKKLIRGLFDTLKK